MLHYVFVRNHGLNKWVTCGEKFFELHNKLSLGNGIFNNIFSEMSAIIKKEIPYNEQFMKSLLESLYQKSVYRTYEKDTSKLADQQKQDIQIAKEYRKQFWFMVEFLDQLGFIEEIDPVLTEVYEVFLGEDRLVRSFAFKSDSDEFDMYKAMKIAVNSSTKAHALGSQVGCLIRENGSNLQDKLRKCGVKNIPLYRSSFAPYNIISELRNKGYRELVYDDQNEQLYNVERSISDTMIRDFTLAMRGNIDRTLSNL